jgi:hypothetical protein
MGIVGMVHGQWNEGYVTENGAGERIAEEMRGNGKTATASVEG